MNINPAPSSFESTSASGAMIPRRRGGPILVGVILWGTSATATSASPDLPSATPPAQSAEPTTARSRIVHPVRPGPAIAEIRRLSGLTWDQLAGLFKVSRRSLHFWASGSVLTARNEERLHRVLSLFRWFDRGSPTANRAALFASREGVTAFELISEDRLDAAMSTLGNGRSVPRPAPLPISERERRSRAPIRPEVLADALQDRPKIEPGRVRPAKSVRHRSGA